MDRFPNLRLLRKHKPFYSHRKILVCIVLLFYTKTIFIPTSSLNVATIFWRLLDVFANFQCAYAYKQWL
jgi:hypothetical protein